MRPEIGKVFVSQGTLTNFLYTQKQLEEAVLLSSVKRVLSQGAGRGAHFEVSIDYDVD